MRALGNVAKSALEKRIVDALQPLLAEHGFRRRGNVFSRRTAEGNLNVFDLQSARSPEAELRPGLGIVSMRLSNFLRPGKPLSARDIHYGMNLTHLFDGQVNPRVSGDRTFFIAKNEIEAMDISSLIARLLEARGFAWFDQYSSDGAMVEPMSQGRGIPQTWSAVLKELLAGRVPNRDEYEDL